MIRFDCRHFRGAQPCVFNKLYGSECSCPHFSGYRDRILFIKLDAIGDVLRSASLLPAIKARHDAPYIAWLTRKDSIELVGMMPHVDEPIALSEENLIRVMAGDWHHVYSLSNDLTSASLATIAATKCPPIGFYLKNGVITPSNDAANSWLEMAAFDRVKRSNESSYQRIMLRIIGCPDEPVQPPSLQISDTSKRAAAARMMELFGEDRRPRVAINLGSGARWPKKMLDAQQIYRYARLLLEQEHVQIILVGGSAEAAKATSILSLFNATDPVRAALTEGSLSDFVATLTQVDVLLCGDTLALHIATAIGLPTVAVFGPTSPAEIFDFDGLVIKNWASELDCLVCYADCDKEENCMSTLKLPILVGHTIAQLKRSKCSDYAGS